MHELENTGIETNKVKHIEKTEKRLKLQWSVGQYQAAEQSNMQLKSQKGKMEKKVLEEVRAENFEILQEFSKNFKTFQQYCVKHCKTTNSRSSTKL